MENDAWNSLIRPLSRRDLRAAMSAQEEFDGVGSFDLDGNFEPSVTTSFVLSKVV